MSTKLEIPNTLVTKILELCEVADTMKPSMTQDIDRISATKLMAMQVKESLEEFIINQHGRQAVASPEHVKAAVEARIKDIDADRKAMNQLAVEVMSVQKAYREADMVTVNTKMKSVRSTAARKRGVEEVEE
jgi:hypothetical protein